MTAVGFILSTMAFAALGAIVTGALHSGGGFWARQIGRTSFRYANLPVGAVLALGVALFLDGPAMWCALGAAWGMGSTAIGWRWIDPA